MNKIFRNILNQSRIQSAPHPSILYRNRIAYTFERRTRVPCSRAIALCRVNHMWSKINVRPPTPTKLLLILFIWFSNDISIELVNTRAMASKGCATQIHYTIDIRYRKKEVASNPHWFPYGSRQPTLYIYIAREQTYWPHFENDGRHLPDMAFHHRTAWHLAHTITNT